MNALKTTTLLLALLISTALSAQVDKAAYNVDDSKVALQGFSPVSYLDLGLAQRGNKAYKSSHDGLNYYFTDAEQKAKFDRDPAKYLPAYGGYCAFGVYAGAKFRTDPNKFLVSNGKLYLFLYDVEVDAKQLWVAENEKTLISKANSNWAQLKKQP